MREITPTRSAVLELADERKLMRQGYDFLDEKRMLLASEMLRQLHDYQKDFEKLVAQTKEAARALADAVERHGLDQLQIYPVGEAPAIPDTMRSLFLGLAVLSAGESPSAAATGRAAVDPSPEAKACRAAFERLLWMAADAGLRAGNLTRLCARIPAHRTARQGAGESAAAGSRRCNQAYRRTARHHGTRGSHPHSLVQFGCGHLKGTGGLKPPRGRNLPALVFPIFHTALDATDARKQRPSLACPVTWCDVAIRPSGTRSKRRHGVKRSALAHFEGARFLR